MNLQYVINNKQNNIKDSTGLVLGVKVETIDENITDDIKPNFLLFIFYPPYKLTIKTGSFAFLL